MTQIYDPKFALSKIETAPANIGQQQGPLLTFQRQVYAIGKRVL